MPAIEHYPNFLFIGPDKAGSTWLYDALRNHSQVYLPTVKELFFFDRYYNNGWDWYGSYFKNISKEQRAVGEISHDYLFSPKACERIAHDLPSVKLMVCLREPVERAFSAYLYMVKQGRVRVDFDTAIEQVEELVDHGRYAKHLIPYLETFGRARIHIAVFDDLVSSPQKFFDEICDFLDIKRMELHQELKDNVLPAARPRSPLWAGFARRAGSYVRAIGMPGVVSHVKNSDFVNRILYSTYKSGEKPKMSELSRERLRGVFSPEVKQLDGLLEYDFSSRWRYQTND